MKRMRRRRRSPDSDYPHLCVVEEEKVIYFSLPLHHIYLSVCRSSLSLSLSLERIEDFS